MTYTLVVYSLIMLGLVGGIFYQVPTQRGAHSLEQTYWADAIKGSDQEAPDILGQRRNLEFNITYGELSAVLEYHILNAKGGESTEEGYLCPISLPDSEDSCSQDTKTAPQSTVSLQPVIPFGLGLKIPLGRITSLDLNLGLRKTFFDYIDNTSAETFEEKELHLRRPIQYRLVPLLEYLFFLFYSIPLLSRSCFSKEEAHNY